MIDGRGNPVKSGGLSQEGLKLIACVTMLLDHVGAVLFPGVGLRIIGRTAFPIYCFLLAEGARHTRSPGRYALRLGVGAVLAEVPFDLLFFGGLTPEHQSVMVTLLLGLGMALWMRRGRWKIVPMILCAAAAQWLNSDYGWAGIVMIWIFVVTERVERKRLWQALLLAAVCLSMDSMRISLAGLRVPIQVFAVLALIPIGCYSGCKRTGSRMAQWGFYLFYPVHLVLLWLLV